MQISGGKIPVQSQTVNDPCPAKPPVFEYVNIQVKNFARKRILWRYPNLRCPDMKKYK
jgi:hypothetical protein